MSLPMLKKILWFSMLCVQTVAYTNISQESSVKEKLEQYFINAMQELVPALRFERCNRYDFFQALSALSLVDAERTAYAIAFAFHRSRNLFFASLEPTVSKLISQPGQDFLANQSCNDPYVSMLLRNKLALTDLQTPPQLAQSILEMFAQQSTFSIAQMQDLITQNSTICDATQFQASHETNFDKISDDFNATYTLCTNAKEQATRLFAALDKMELNSKEIATKAQEAMTQFKAQIKAEEAKIKKLKQKTPMEIIGALAITPLAFLQLSGLGGPATTKLFNQSIPEVKSTCSEGYIQAAKQTAVGWAVTKGLDTAAAFVTKFIWRIKR